jgi:hypothetical protein
MAASTLPYESYLSAFVDRAMAARLNVMAREREILRSRLGPAEAARVEETTAFSDLLLSLDPSKYVYDVSSPYPKAMWSKSLHDRNLV